MVSAPITPHKEEVIGPSRVSTQGAESPASTPRNKKSGVKNFLGRWTRNRSTDLNASGGSSSSVNLGDNGDPFLSDPLNRSATMPEKSTAETNGMFIWHPADSEADGVIDVIAVHGLNGDAHQTWEERGNIWLRDFLPSQIPHLRIMSYGYNSRVLFSRSTADPADFASELLARVYGNRHSAKERARPLVFICHSLGGIVVKQALISAHENSSNLGNLNILTNTKGLVFMAVPHLGSDMTTWYGLVAQLVNTLNPGPTTNAALVRGLKKNSELLTRTCLSFTEQSKQFKILTFYETLTCFGLRDLIVTRDSALLKIPGERVVSVNADHKSICRFGDKDSQSYALVWHEIRDLIENIRSPSKEFGDETCRYPYSQQASFDSANLMPVTQSDESDINELQRCLYKIFVSQTAKSNITSRIEGTCEWILQHAKYVHWQAKETDSNVLWISGGPGCGKTVLSSYLISDLAKSQSTLAICSFFCDDKSDARKVLCRLIYDLLDQNRSLARHALSHWKSKGEGLAQDWVTLSSIWQACCSDERSGNLTVVIDALDECDSSSRPDLLELLAPSTHSSASDSMKSRVKVLITSRPEKDLALFLKNVPRITLEHETDSLPSDINLVIQHGMQSLVEGHNLRSEKAEELSEKLRAGAGGTFLWVAMVFKLLKSSAGSRDFDRLIEDPPKELIDVYRRILDRIEEDAQQRSRLALQLVTMARRPLTVFELDMLLAINAEHRTEAQLKSIAEADPNQSILSACCSLAKIVVEKGESYVYLIHHTVKEFLLRRIEDSSADTARPWHSFTTVEGNLALAERCIWALHLRELDISSLPQWSANEDEFEVYAQNYAAEHILSKYAGSYWAAHFRDCQTLASDDILEQAIMLYKPGSRYTTWSQLYWAFLPSLPRHYKPLHMCSHNGHYSVLERLLKACKGDGKDEKDEEGTTPLHRAAEAGYERIIELLHYHGADLTIRDASHKTALHRAAHADQIAAVRCLARLGANVDARLGGSTALHLAAERGLESMVRTLVECDADVELLDGEGELAADLAFNKGHGSIYSFLVTKETDVGNSQLDQAIIDGDEHALATLISSDPTSLHKKDNRGQSPLHRAAKGGNLRIVALLSFGNASPNVVDDNGASPVHIAAKHGNPDVMGALFEAGADINIKNTDGLTPLHQAVISGREESVKWLVDAKALIDAVDDERETAFFKAANLGYLDILKLLLDKECSPDQASRNDDTALHTAAEKGHPLIVEYLLQRNIFDVDARNKKEETPLTLAARGASASHAQVVRLLLRNQAKATAAQMNLGTPIMFAAECGNIVSMKHILDMPGVDPDVRDNDRCTPLQKAASNGHERAILLLLEYGAKTVKGTGHGMRTPLNWAAEKGLEKAVVQLLRFPEVRPDLPEGDNGQIALSLAAGNGHLTVVRHLSKDRRVTIDALDGSGRSPLSWAAGNGHEKVVEFLLAKGSDPRLSDEHARTPMAWAARYGHVATIELLLRATSYSPAQLRDKANSTLLLLAARGGHEKMVKFLLGWDPSCLNEPDQALDTPLTEAALAGHGEVVRILLSCENIDVNSRNFEHKTALALAASAGNAEIVEQLLAHRAMDINAQDSDKNTPLWLAAYSGYTETVRILQERHADINIPNSKGDTALHIAAENGHFEIVEALCRDSAQVTLRNRTGDTPFLQAAKSGSEKTIGLFLAKLRDSNGNPGYRQEEHVNDEGYTPLIVASASGTASVVRRLLEFPGTNVNTSNVNGLTAVMFAVIRGNAQVTEVLLAHGADATAPDSKLGRSALLWACCEGATDQIEQIISSKGVDLSVTDKSKASALKLAATHGSAIAVSMLLKSSVVNLNLAEATNGWTPLMAAANRGDAAITSVLLSQSEMQPNIKDKDGRTAMMLATLQGHESVVRLLLEFPGIDVNICDNHETSALIVASRTGHDDIARLLLSSHTDGLDIDHKNAWGCTALWYAVVSGHTAIVQLLLSHGASPVVKGPREESPLIAAARAGFYTITKSILEHLEDPSGDIITDRSYHEMSIIGVAASAGHDNIVRLLLDHGADPNIHGGKTERTPLMEAAHGGHANVARVLLDHENIEPDRENDAGRTALWFCCSNSSRGASEIFEMILTYEIRLDSNDHRKRYTPLMNAAQLGLFDNVRRLLERGADPNLKDEDGWTAFIFAARRGYTSIARLLLDHKEPKIDPNATSNNGETALMFAAVAGHHDVVQLLLKLSPQVLLDVRSAKSGLTALMFAAQNARTKIVTDLIRAGASVSAIDKQDRSVLHHATASGALSVVNAVVEAGADLNIRGKEGSTPLIFASMLGHDNLVRFFLGKVDVRLRDRSGRTALSHAMDKVTLDDGLVTGTQSGEGDDGEDKVNPNPEVAPSERRDDQETARILIREGKLNLEDINSRDNRDYTPAMWAAIAGHREVLSFMHQEGADLGVFDRNRRTLLSHAAQRGSTSVVLYLLSQSRDIVNLQDKAGRTALSWAAEAGSDAVIRVLLAHGADAALQDKKGKTAKSYALENDQKKIVKQLELKG